MNLTCDEVRELAAGYVLDALEEAERDAVVRHLAECREPHPELAELAQVVPALAHAIEPIEPRAQLRDRLMAAAAAEAISARGGAVATPPPMQVAPAAMHVAQPRRPLLAWAVAGVALVVAVALAGMAVLQSGDLADLRDYRQGVSEVLDLAARDGSQVAVLTAEGDAGPRGLAAVGSDGRVAVALQGLAPTTGSQVYELWIIAGDSPPLALGGIRVDADGAATWSAAAPTTDAPLTLAVTLEPLPGAQTAAGPVVAVGQASSPN